MTAVLTNETTMAATSAAPTRSRRRRYTAVPADLLEHFKVSEWTLLRWRRRGWLGGRGVSLWVEGAGLRRLGAGGPRRFARHRGRDLRSDDRPGVPVGDRGLIVDRW
jgi:hypothetical protein